MIESVGHLLDFMSDWSLIAQIAAISLAVLVAICLGFLFYCFHCMWLSRHNKGLHRDMWYRLGQWIEGLFDPPRRV